MLSKRIHIFFQALADIKPEVESTIKMGRKLVDSGSVVDGPDTTRKIDALKEMFNVLGAQVQLTQQYECFLLSIF